MTSPFSIKQFLRLLKDLSRDALGQRIDRKANEFGNRRGRGSRAARRAAACSSSSSVGVRRVVRQQLIRHDLKTRRTVSEAFNAH